jgi:hypothetical protein
MLILSNPLLLLLLWAPNVIRLPSLEGDDEGGGGSTWGGVHLGRNPLVLVPLSLERPLNLVLYIPFRIFAYSFKCFKG